VPERQRRSIALRCKPGIHLLADRGPRSSAPPTKPPATAARPNHAVPPPARHHAARSRPLCLRLCRPVGPSEKSGATRRAESGHDGLTPDALGGSARLCAGRRLPTPGPNCAPTDPTPGHPPRRSAECSAHCVAASPPTAGSPSAAIHFLRFLPSDLMR
jgi:hypothetical protein